MKILSALWPDAAKSGALTLWFTPTKLSFHFPVSTLPLSNDDVAELREQADANKWNVYFGLGLRCEGLEPDQQGGKKDTIALPAFVLDIDFYNPAHPDAHVAQNLPRNLEEAVAVLFTAGTPDPSAIIATGNGVHVYWFFDKPIWFTSANHRVQVQKAYKAFQKPFIDRAAARGWQLDSTSTVQRVWRLPGFNNQKTGRPVETLYLDADVRYEPSELGVGDKFDDDPAPSPPRQAVDVTDIRSALKSIKPTNTFYDAIKKVLAGESMAPGGQRDIVLQGVCSTIAWLPEGRHIDAAELAEVLRPSLQKWADEPDATKSIEEELEKAADKIARSQEDWHEQQAAKAPQLDGIARALGKKTGNGVPNSFFEHHAIISKRSTYYVFDFQLGRYSVPKTREELPLYLPTAWEDGPIPMYFINGDGTKKEKPLTHILKHNGCNSDEVIGDLTIEESRYDPKERTFYEAMARRRVHDSEFDDDIDTWLKLLCGTHYDKVCDWIAAVPQLQHQLCVLYLDGVSGTGKGLLANGLSRLWTTGGPTPFANVLGDFNSDIVECPLLFADEGIPHRKGDVSSELRALVGSSKLTLNEKYMTPRKVNGSIRLMLAANNDEALLFGNENLSVNDLEAVVGRFLHVDAQREAADWIKANNSGGHMTRAWVEGDRLAMHCLALSETRQINPGKRFLVEGDETHMHRKLLMQGSVDGLVHEWLVRFASKPSVVATRYKGKQEPSKAIIADGAIMVNTQCVIDCWDGYMGDSRRPSTRKVGHALKKLATRTTRRGPRGDRSRYYVIAPEMVVELAEEMQIGSEDQILANVQASIAENENNNAVA
jgi:hypothetical protein